MAITAGDRVAGIMGRQMLSIAQLESDLESANERNVKLQEALKQVSEELAAERSKGGRANQEPPTPAELSP